MPTRRGFLVLLAGTPALASKPGHITRVRSDLKEHENALERLRAFKLSNSDEPDFTFASLTKRWE